MVDDDGESKAETALIIWYEKAAHNYEHPDVVEFSFRYSLGESHPPSWDEAANRVFGKLQDQMTNWFDPDSPTKTKFVYANC